MVAELEQDLLHLECGREGFDEDRRTDSVQRQADIRLGEGEDIVPQTGLEIVFHLGQVEVGTRAPLDKLLGIVIEEERKVKDGSRHRLIVDGDAGLV